MHLFVGTPFDAGSGTLCGGLGFWVMKASETTCSWCRAAIAREVDRDYPGC